MPFPTLFQRPFRLLTIAPFAALAVLLAAPLLLALPLEPARAAGNQQQNGTVQRPYGPPSADPEITAGQAPQTQPKQTQPSQSAPSSAPQPPAQGPSTPEPPAPQSPGLQVPGAFYNPAMFQSRVPSDQLSFLGKFAGMPAKQLIHDKQYHQLMQQVTPNCIFHYGRDMSLPDAVEMVMSNSPIPVEIRDGRYVMVEGQSGPYLAGRGFMWIDIQDGIALGGFYFHPTNGEPAPVVIIYSKQVRERDIRMSQLPAAFAEDLAGWARAARVPALTTRYFITANSEKIMLEHDEDYCQPLGTIPAPPDDICEQMNADAADLDLTAAYYLEQINYATNGTAWMVTPQEQITWIAVRDSSCGIGLQCRVAMTRQRTWVIINRRRPVPPPPPPHR